MFEGALAGLAEDTRPMRIINEEQGILRQRSEIIRERSGSSVVGEHSLSEQDDFGTRPAAPRRSRVPPPR